MKASPSPPRCASPARALLLCALLSLAGCGTLADTLGDKHRDERSFSRVRGGQVRIYGGVRYDAAILYEAKAGWLLALYVLDCPISAAIDTLLLPFTIPYNLLR